MLALLVTKVDGEHAFYKSTATGRHCRLVRLRRQVGKSSLCTDFYADAQQRQCPEAGEVQSWRWAGNICWIRLICIRLSGLLSLPQKIHFYDGSRAVEPGTMACMSQAATVYGVLLNALLRHPRHATCDMLQRTYEGMLACFSAFNDLRHQAEYSTMAVSLLYYTLTLARVRHTKPRSTKLIICRA